MDREDGLRSAERGLLERGIQEHGHEAGGPVVAMDDVGGPAGRQAGVKSGSSVEGGPFAGVVTLRIDFAGTVEILVFDEPGLEVR